MSQAGYLEEEPAEQREQKVQRPQGKHISHFQGTSQQGRVTGNKVRMVARVKFLVHLRLSKNIGSMVR